MTVNSDLLKLCLPGGVAEADWLESPQVFKRKPYRAGATHQMLDGSLAQDYVGDTKYEWTLGWEVCGSATACFIEYLYEQQYENGGSLRFYDGTRFFSGNKWEWVIIPNDGILYDAPAGFNPVLWSFGVVLRQCL